MKAMLEIARNKELTKLVRQKNNFEATEVAIKVLGDTPKERAKLVRQEAAIKETEANIKKLDAAIAKAKK